MDHLSNGLVGKFVHSVKTKLLAMSLEQQKPTLQFAISRNIWNLRSSFQSKIKFSPFEIHFNRKPNTIWKQLASSKLSGGFLDKRKSTLSKERALDWNADDQIEDGYKDSLVPKKNQSPLEKGYDSDYPTASKPSSSRVSPNSPFKGKFLRNTKGGINGNPFYKQLGQKKINSSKSTVELSDGKVIRKSDIAISKSKPSNSTTRSFRGNIATRKGSNAPLNKTKKVEGENPIDFPIFEIENSSYENVIFKESHPKETAITGTDFKLGRSSRNVGPPQFYGKRLYIDILDENDNQPGSSKKPIPLDENDRSGSPPPISTKNPSDIQTPTFDIQSEECTSGSAISSSSEQISLTSTDESLRDVVISFDK